MKIISLDSAVTSVKIRKEEKVFEKPLHLYLDQLNSFDLDKALKITAKVAAVMVMIFSYLYIF